MSRTVHKFPLDGGQAKQIVASRYFRPLHVGMQNGDLMLWAEVEIGGGVPQITKHSFKTIGTGDQVPFAGEFIGTVQESDSRVWHVYRVTI